MTRFDAIMSILTDGAMSILEISSDIMPVISKLFRSFPLISIVLDTDIVLCISFDLVSVSGISFDLNSACVGHLLP